MKLSDSLLIEFDIEMANTRKTLERIPEEKLNWKPHKKSWSMRELATHLSNISSWAGPTLNQDSLDIAPPDSSLPERLQPATVQGILELFNKNIADARTAIANTTDEHFSRPWTLLSGGKSIFTLPRIAVLRTFILNHNIHHRAQLCIYLRLNDVPVPAIYGPSADEE